jgi:hypothetical protein
MMVLSFVSRVFKPPTALSKAPTRRLQIYGGLNGFVKR